MGSIDAHVHVWTPDTAHYQRSLSAAQKRYLAAIKALAVVRKHVVPVLQVNIARKQVNVARACPVPES
jgi:hypothetical protein